MHKAFRRCAGVRVSVFEVERVRASVLQGARLCEYVLQGARKFF